MFLKLVYTDTSTFNNTTYISHRSCIGSKDIFLNTQDNEIVDILEYLPCPTVATIQI